MENDLVSHRISVSRLAGVAAVLCTLLLASCQSTQSATQMTPANNDAAARIAAAENTPPMTQEEEAVTLAKIQELQASDPMSGVNRLDPTGLSSLAAAKRNHAKMQAMQGDIARLMVAQRNRALALCKSRPEIKECAELRKLQ